MACVRACLVVDLSLILEYFYINFPPWLYVRVARLTALVFHQDPAAAAKAAEAKAAAEAEALSAHKHTRAVTNGVRESVTMGSESLFLLPSWPACPACPNTVYLRLTCSIMAFISRSSDPHSLQTKGFASAGLRLIPECSHSSPSPNLNAPSHPSRRQRRQWPGRRGRCGKPTSSPSVSLLLSLRVGNVDCTSVATNIIQEAFSHMLNSSLLRCIVFNYACMHWPALTRALSDAVGRSEEEGRGGKG
jgi:hypothetical protein